MTSHRVLIPKKNYSNSYVTISEKHFLDFSSNDYLGLATNNAHIKKVTCSPIKQYGSTGSRLLSGNHEQFEEFERQLASWLNVETTLLFNSGYQLNCGVIAAFVGKNDCIIADKSIHASIIDGIRLSGAKLFRYKHQDMNDCERLLEAQREKYNRCIIVTESLFSMDGDKTNLDQCVRLKKKFNCMLYVDEAHALGVFGSSGEGLSQPVIPDIDFLVGTFGKAFGSIGAFLGCSAKHKEQLINHCRSFIYSTALPLPLIEWNSLTLKTIKKMNKERQSLHHNALFFREKLLNLPIKVYGNSQIISVSTKPLENCSPSKIFIG